jgi:hypothetical protein
MRELVQRVSRSAVGWSLIAAALRFGSSLLLLPLILWRIPSDTFIYHLMPKLRSTSRFIEMNPFSANGPGSRLSSDLGQADWIVLNRAWDDWPEQNRSRENGPEEPLRLVRNNFIVVKEYGSFELFRRKAKVGAE